MLVNANPKKLPRAELDRWMKRAPKSGTNAGYWENVACARVVLGELDEAMVALQQAVALGFDKEAIAADKSLAPLRKRDDYKALFAPPATAKKSTAKKR